MFLLYYLCQNNMQIGVLKFNFFPYRGARKLGSSSKFSYAAWKVNRNKYMKYLESYLVRIVDFVNCDAFANPKVTLVIANFETVAIVFLTVSFVVLNIHGESILREVNAVQLVVEYKTIHWIRMCSNTRTGDCSSWGCWSICREHRIGS